MTPTQLGISIRVEHLLQPNAPFLRHNILHSARVLDALIRLSQITIGTSTLVQAAVPKIFDALMGDEEDRHPHSDSQNSDSNSHLPLASAHADYLTEFMSNCQASLAIAIEQIERIACLSCTSEPKGAMYLMVSRGDDDDKGEH